MATYAARYQESRSNLSDTERMASVIGGGILALAGVTLRGSWGIMLPALGGVLAYRGVSGYCPVYASVGLSTANSTGAATSVQAGHGCKVEESVIVERSADDLYSMWRKFEELPRYMKNLREVQVLDEKRSRWICNGPLGTPVQWDAEIINERPGELIAWRSLEGSTVSTAGSVHFQPAVGGRGTEMRVSLKYDPPAGKLGASLAWLMGASPEGQLRADLGRFKQFAESGEVATVTGQPMGKF